MLGRDTKQQKKRGGKSNSSGPGTHSRLVGAVLLVLALVMALAGYGFNYLQQEEGARNRLLQARIAAEGVAGKLSEFVGFHSNLLTRYAQTPQLPQLLQSRDWDALARHEARLLALMQGAVRVRFLPLEWDQLDPDADPPFGYASLEMVNTVDRTAQPSPAEVHQLGSQHQHIAMAAPIRGGGEELAGVAHLVLPFAVLRQHTEIGNRKTSRFAVQQVVGGVTAALVDDGVGEQTPSAGTVPVPGTIWQVAYWPAQVPVGLMQKPIFWGILSAATATFGLLLVLLSIQQRRYQPVALQAAVPKQGGVAPQVPSGDRESDDAQSNHEVMAAIAAKVQTAQPAAPDTGISVAQEGPAASIFRAYDIRGVVGDTLTADDVYLLGRAIGSEADAQEEPTLIIARDGRHSSAALSEALARGLAESGRRVVDLGQVPTPVLYFATHYLGSSSGVMVTGSHNPPEYNGLKVVIAGEALHGERIQQLRLRIESGQLSEGEGDVQFQDLLPDYIDRIVEDVQLLGELKVVVDCANGVASVAVPTLFRALGCEVEDLYCEVDGSFPNHHPDPGDPENMRALIKRVRESGADIGIAFDGDGDRLGVVDSNGKIIWPDRVLMLLARDILMRQPGADVIYDIKSSRHLASEILTYGGRPIMWHAGHSLVKAKMRETGALLGGELSGHIYIKERWYGFDDALYAAARLLEVISSEGLSSAEVFAQFPESLSTAEILVSLPEGDAPRIVEQLSPQLAMTGAKLITLDGIRAEFEDGWGLVRASNTTPGLSLRFEGDDEAALVRIQALFREQILAIRPELELPF